MKFISILVKVMKSTLFWVIMFIASVVVSIPVNVGKTAKIKQCKAENKQLRSENAELLKTPAEVQCTVELNIKSNKNGILIIDANQQAAKIADEINKKLKNK